MAMGFFESNEVQNYYVQFQDLSGWRTCLTMSATNGPQRLLIEMRNAKECYPGHRIRVVDDDGRLIDLLTEY